MVRADPAIFQREALYRLDGAFWPGGNRSMIQVADVIRQIKFVAHDVTPI